MSSSAITRFTATSFPKQVTAKSDTAIKTIENALEISDEIILKRIHEGDREAFGLLFRRYAQLVYQVGRRIIRNQTEADDLVQEVFLYIHRKSSLFDSSKGSARSWIVQVAYTQAFLRRRRLKSHGFYLSAIADRSPETDCQSYSGAEYDQSVEGLFGRSSWHK